jgi:Arc/MetJ-type ribon-helix-helix transcriptional regulator
MTVTLTPELEQIVNDQLATGQFTDPEQVVAVSLKFLRRQYEELKAMLTESEEDVRNGRVAPLDVMAIWARVKARREAQAGGEPCVG